MGEMIQDYFQKLFKMEATRRQTKPINSGFPFTRDEIKTTLFDMAPFKAPGKGGLHVGFFQET